MDGISEQYVIDYLREEFSRYPDVRVRKIIADHEAGLSVRTSSREYFFPMDWAHRQDFDKIRRLVCEIKEGLGEF